VQDPWILVQRLTSALSFLVLAERGRLVLASFMDILCW
jgi:hypothetical protein